MITNMSLSSSANAAGIADCGVSAMNETPLLAAAKRGCPEAFEALCGIHRSKLFGAALRITRNREDAEDALQDSLMRAFIHIKDFNGRSKFSTWLTRIVINSALMIRRKNSKAREVPADEFHPEGEGWLEAQIPDDSPNPEQRYVEGERIKVLHKAISGLRPRIRAVLEIGQLQGLSVKETARVLDISVAAAKGRMFHARNALGNSVALRSIARARAESAA